jgi:hypothetical protein
MGRLRVLAAMAIGAWSVTAGAGVASAGTRLRSGTVHAQVASHVATGANAVSSGLTQRASEVMAIIVGVQAVLALTFLVVTFIRGRMTVT